MSETVDDGKLHGLYVLSGAYCNIMYSIQQIAARVGQYKVTLGCVCVCACVCVCVRACVCVCEYRYHRHAYLYEYM